MTNHSHSPTPSLRSFLSMVVIASALFVVLSTHFKVSAQVLTQPTTSLGTTPSVPTSPTGTTFSLSVNPPVAYISLKPGEMKMTTVTIENQGTTSVSLTPTLVDFEPDPSGTGVALSEQSTFPYLDPSRPTQLNEQLTLQPGDRRTIQVPIKVPLSAATSEHHVTILFPSNATDMSGSTTGANISGIIGSNLIVMIAPDIQDLSQLRIDRYEGVRFVDSFSPISFKLWARNDGPLAGVASGSAQLLSGTTNQVISEWSFFPDVVLAHSQRLLRTTGKEVTEPDDEIQPSTLFSFKSPFLLGSYRVNVIFGSANQLDRVETSYPVIAFPFLITGLIVICITLVFGYKFIIWKLPIGKHLKTY